MRNLSKNKKVEFNQLLTVNVQTFPLIESYFLNE